MPEAFSWLLPAKAHSTQPLSLGERQHYVRGLGPPELKRRFWLPTQASLPGRTFSGTLKLKD